jgi:hypothetical protein
MMMFSSMTGPQRRGSRRRQHHLRPARHGASDWPRSARARGTGQALHDVDKSAWWILINLVPAIGGPDRADLLRLHRGTPGRNQFGDPPA